MLSKSRFQYNINISILLFTHSYDLIFFWQILQCKPKVEMLEVYPNFDTDPIK